MKKLTSWVVAAIVVITGCNALSEPAHELNLDGSSWSVVSIDGVISSTPPPSITFDSPARVDTGCRTIYVSWDMDTDGSALSFESPNPSVVQCSAELAAQDAMVVSSIAGTGSWSVNSHDAIVLHGDHEVHLERRDPTGG